MGLRERHQRGLTTVIITINFWPSTPPGNWNQTLSVREPGNYKEQDLGFYQSFFPLHATVKYNWMNLCRWMQFSEWVVVLCLLAVISSEYLVAQSVRLWCAYAIQPTGIFGASDTVQKGDDRSYQGHPKNWKKYIVVTTTPKADVKLGVVNALELFQLPYRLTANCYGLQKQTQYWTDILPPATKTSLACARSKHLQLFMAFCFQKRLVSLTKFGGLHKSAFTNLVRLFTHYSLSHIYSHWRLL